MLAAETTARLGRQVSCPTCFRLARPTTVLILSAMAYQARPVPLQGERLLGAVSDVLQGVSVRMLAARYGTSMADAAALARWSGPLLDAFASAWVVAGPQPAPRSFSGADGIAGEAEPQPPPGEKTDQGPRPEQEEEKAQLAPAPADTFDDVPEEWRGIPEAREAYRRALRGAS